MNAVAIKRRAEPMFDERVLWLGLIAAGALDVVSTVVGLNVGLTEANPLVSQLIQSHGIMSLVVIKAGCIAAIAGCYAVQIKTGYQRYALRSVAFVTAIWLLFAVNNIARIALVI